MPSAARNCELIVSGATPPPVPRLSAESRAASGPMSCMTRDITTLQVLPLSQSLSEGERFLGATCGSAPSAAGEEWVLESVPRGASRSRKPLRTTTVGAGPKSWRWYGANGRPDATIVVGGAHGAGRGGPRRQQASSEASR